MPDFLYWRKRFPILANKTYLINNSLGAMPDSVPAALAEYTNLWVTEGVVAWDTWLPARGINLGRHRACAAPVHDNVPERD